MDKDLSVKKIEKPNLLVISVNAWSDTNSTGNTISNHFGGWDSTKISNIFLRDEMIDNNCCSSYFRICEKDIINSFFSRKELGEEVQFVKEKNKQANPKNIKVSIIKSFLIRIRPTIILLLRELFWKIGFQRKNKLDNFLKEKEIDVIHIHCPSIIYGHRMLHYCHKVTKAKVVLFFGDEIYSHKNYGPLGLLYQLILRNRIRKSIKISDINYAATPELCDYYSHLFGEKFEVLYKGAIIPLPVPSLHEKPLKIVYAGNLLYDRWKTLALISKAIDEVSKEKTEFQLFIYTSTALSKEMSEGLNTKYSSVLGAVSFNKVKKIMREADIVLHAESFKKKYINITKYSFSTKIVDCIQSGSCIMGVGPIELASINFLEKSKAAIIANTYKEIYTELHKICLNNKVLNENPIKMYYFSKDIFNLDIIRDKIYNDITELCILNK